MNNIIVRLWGAGVGLVFVSIICAEDAPSFIIYMMFITGFCAAGSFILKSLR